MTRWVPFTHSTSLKGPQPTTASGLPALRSSGVYFCVAVGEYSTRPMRYVASMCIMNAYGCFSRICTVYGSTTSTACTGSRNVRILDRVAGSMMRSMLNFTAAAVTLVPSWKRTFFLSLNV